MRSFSTLSTAVGDSVLEGENLALMGGLGVFKDKLPCDAIQYGSDLHVLKERVELRVTNTVGITHMGAKALPQWLATTDQQDQLAYYCCLHAQQPLHQLVLIIVFSPRLIC